jgi:L-ascorbate metabolism protein UlaG (beta-lactamase superfamily)
MKIQRFAHATMLVEVDGARILIDPTSLAPDWTDLTDVSAIVITHDHFDHIDPGGIKTVLENHADLKIYADDSAGKILDDHKIPHQTIKPGDEFEIEGVKVTVFGGVHAPIHPSLPPMNNVGLVIADRLCYPGDSFDLPPQPVEILALPTSGPWMKLAEVIDYILAVKPHYAIPVHDALYTMPAMAHDRIAVFAREQHIEFIDLKPGQSHDFDA